MWCLRLRNGAGWMPSARRCCCIPTGTRRRRRKNGSARRISRYSVNLFDLQTPLSNFAPVSAWDPNLYLRFEAYRTRAARDLLAPVDLPEVRFAVDLGCAPGNSTGLLVERWPAARITGVDNSEAMLERAREAYPNVTWIRADLADWSPPEPLDLIFANASFHWVPNH